MKTKSVFILLLMLMLVGSAPVASAQGLSAPTQGIKSTVLSYQDQVWNVIQDLGPQWFKPWKPANNMIPYYRNWGAHYGELDFMTLALMAAETGGNTNYNSGGKQGLFAFHPVWNYDLNIPFYANNMKEPRASIRMALLMLDRQWALHNQGYNRPSGGWYPFAHAKEIAGIVHCSDNIYKIRTTCSDKASFMSNYEYWYYRLGGS